MLRSIVEKRTNYTIFDLGLKLVVLFLLLFDLTYGLILGSTTSLIRFVGHLAMFILLLIRHSENKFSLSLWAWVMLILLPLIYPGICLLYTISDNLEAINLRRLAKNLIWIGTGIFILYLNSRNKFNFEKAE